MKIHHIDCGTMCPVSRRLVGGDGGLFEPARLVCHCLLIEAGRELVLVDTGLGVRDFAEPRRRLGAMFMAFARPQLDPELAAVNQIRRLGLSPADVRHIVVTHLDLDHAGGLSDFPEAQVHVFEREHAAAMARRSWAERGRYRPVHWEHGPKWATHAVGGEPWFGFESVRPLEGLPPEILLVPLVGHSRGHCGVAVDTGSGFLLHAGDAYYFHGELDPERPRATPALDVLQKLEQVDAVARMRNLVRLRTLAREHAGEVRIFSAHDPLELEREQAASQAGVPAAVGGDGAGRPAGSD
jgi:glyoxylase-like metal-dependent hydrolase (beta-lactamase superfamily II)